MNYLQIPRIRRMPRPKKTTICFHHRILLVCGLRVIASQTDDPPRRRVDFIVITVSFTMMGIGQWKFAFLSMRLHHSLILVGGAQQR